MAAATETEIKLRVADPRAFPRRLRGMGFRVLHARERESNVLYDFPGSLLTLRGELLRLRRYGEAWKLTHKARGKPGRHKARVETEVGVASGEKLADILRALGLAPIFRYEKFRSQWSDGRGTVTLDETPIGVFAEIEGSPGWIDATARRLGASPKDYITETYAGLFFNWKRRNRSRANEMTFAAVGKLPRS